MTRHPVTADPRELARLLLAQVREAWLLSLEELSSDPAAAIEASPDVRITWVEPSSLPPTCSIAAACDKSCTPARLLISKDNSVGRRRFSVLHEYAHFLRDLVPDVLDVLFTSANAGEALEERMCDEFASAVLLPDTLLESALGPAVTARAVLSLIAAAPASAEACAVAAARRLPAPGYVMLLSPDGTATFTAHHKDVYYVRRGTAQEGLLRRAASGVPVRGRDQVRYSTGNRGRELLLDAASENGRTVAVLVTDSPHGAASPSGGNKALRASADTAGTVLGSSTALRRPATRASSHPAPNAANAPAKHPKGQQESACAIAVTSCSRPPHTLTPNLRLAKSAPDREHDRQGARCPRR